MGSLTGSRTPAPSPPVEPGGSSGQPPPRSATDQPRHREGPGGGVAAAAAAHPLRQQTGKPTRRRGRSLAGATVGTEGTRTASPPSTKRAAAPGTSRPVPPPASAALPGAPFPAEPAPYLPVAPFLGPGRCCPPGPAHTRTAARRLLSLWRAHTLLVTALELRHPHAFIGTQDMLGRGGASPRSGHGEM